MAYLASDVISDAQLWLNDSAGQFFTSTVLLPYVKRAFEEMQAFLRTHEAPIAFKIFNGTIASGLTSRTLAQLSIADMILPEYMEERTSGVANELYVPMTRKSPLPSRLQGPTLGEWDWIEDTFQFVGANNTRQVNIYYWKSLTPIAIAADTVPVLDARAHLGYRVAALAAMFNGENETRATSLQNEADKFFDQLLRALVLNQQTVRTRRKPYGRRAIW